MPFTATPSRPSHSLFNHRQQSPSLNSLTTHPKTTVKFLSFQTHLPPLQASRRISTFPQGRDSVVNHPRNWSRAISSEFVDDDGEDDDEDDDEEEDRSLDLLVRFIQNMFKKISRKARKAVRSVLPVTISTKLVGFSVNGVLVLAFLWVLKAFLEVICTLGSVVFVSILLVRGIWAGVTYLQENRNLKLNGLDDDYPTWNGAQPAT